jgi:hypothetical protein
MAIRMVLAIDYGRWLILAVMNVSFAAVVLRINESTSPNVSVREGTVGTVLIVALLVMGIPKVHSPSPAVDRVAGRILGPMALETTKLFTCDPDWHNML